MQCVRLLPQSHAATIAAAIIPEFATGEWQPSRFTRKALTNWGESQFTLSFIEGAASLGGGGVFFKSTMLLAAMFASRMADLPNVACSRMPRSNRLPSASSRLRKVSRSAMRLLISRVVAVDTSRTRMRMLSAVSSPIDWSIAAPSSRLAMLMETTFGLLACQTGLDLRIFPVQM
jgi:hypothetical protein